MAVQTAQISVTPRSQLGSRHNKRLRDSGQIPGVIYGHKEAVVPIALPKKEVVSHISHGAHLFDLALEGKSEKVLIKEVQYDHLGMELIHVDFARVSLDERVKVTVAIELRGEPKGEADGAVLQQFISELEVECLVTEIPEIIRHNVSEMGKDAELHVKDLALPPGVVAMQEGDLLVAAVREIQEEAAAPATEEGAAEPELIGRKPEEGEEAAEGAAAPAAEKK